MRAKTGLFVAACCLALGCGSDDKAASGGKVNESLAKQNADQTIGTVTDLIASTDATAGQTAANRLMGVAQSAQGIVTPDVGTGAGTCECAGTSCTFQDCGGESSGASINGTMSWADGKVTSDMTYVVDNAQQKVNLTVKTDLTVTATSISGTVSSTGKTTISGLPAGVPGGTADVSWNNSVTFTDVTYANGKATGGSMTVTASSTTAGQNYGGTATIQFP